MENSQSVLVVEDNSLHLELIEHALKKELKNIQILGASNAAECMQIIGDVDLDLVILDYSLPDQNGIQVLESMRKQNPQLPVLIVTGQGNEKIAVQAIKKG